LAALDAPTKGHKRTAQGPAFPFAERACTASLVQGLSSRLVVRREAGLTPNDVNSNYHNEFYDILVFLKIVPVTRMQSHLSMPSGGFLETGFTRLTGFG